MTTQPPHASPLRHTPLLRSVSRLKSQPTRREGEEGCLSNFLCRHLKRLLRPPLPLPSFTSHIRYTSPQFLHNAPMPPESYSPRSCEPRHPHTPSVPPKTSISKTPHQEQNGGDEAT
ncbi:hypothetical protein M758_9G010500 [Ceratodon purpureus]|nr:hypothetical protein M758_9G010500 [Ceratodon purpureus]